MKEEVLNNDKDHNKNKEVSIWTKMNFYRDIIGVIGITVVYAVLNSTYNFIYQSNCEKFYGITGKYFESSIKENLLYLAGIAFLFVFTFVLVKIDKNTENEIYQRKDTKISVYFCEVIMGILMGITNVSVILRVKEDIQLNIGWNNICDYVLYAINIISFICGIRFPFSFKGNENPQESKSISKKIFNGLSVTFATFTTVLLVIGVLFKFNINIEDKTKYEFVNINQTEYVVLSEYDGSVLVVLYDVNEEGQYVFYTKNYYLFERNEGTYRYENLKHSPIVNKGDRMD